jgi:5-hydroxyisourate hydrolase
MSVSTHVLDTSRGVPADGIGVTLARLTADPSATPGRDSSAGSHGPGHWVTIDSGVTDADGRHRFAVATPTGAYRLTFTTAPYFLTRKVPVFFPEVGITFMVSEPPGAAANGHAAHFHVPLLLSPFGYSTYRGS